MAYPKHDAAAGRPGQPRPARGRAAGARHWAADKTFEAQRRARPAGANGSNEFVFYDGPPFANGLPHYGHLLTGYVKDVVPRYQTMRGQPGRAPLRLGLPRPARRGRGGEAARHHRPRPRSSRWAWTSSTTPAATSVLRYTKDWERYVTRQARWVDFANDYKTLDLDYMESVMWAFKTLHDKGLVYEGFRVLAYCWRCETPLSNTETRMDDVYRDRQDPALTGRVPAGDRREARWSGPPRRGRCRRTWRSPSARTSTTPCSSRTAERLRAGRGAGWAPTPRSWTGCDAGRHGARRGPGRAALHAAVRLPGRAGRAERVPGARRRTSSPPRTAPASCTWRRPSARTTRTPATRPASRPS